MHKTTDAGSLPNLLDRLHHDHEGVKDLFEKICEGLDDESLAATFSELRAALLAHAEAEEKCFYGRLLKEDDESRFFALKADVEHGLVEGLLKRLTDSAEKGSDEWLAGCIVLRELVEHHIDEEEGEGFDIAREILEDGDLEKLGAEFEHEKQRLMKV